MEKSKASWQLRGALKRRTRKWRRRQVFGFYCLMFLWPLFTLGNDHHGFRHFFWAVYPVYVAISQLSQWRRAQQRVVTGLDDRAQVEHGVNFDQLSEIEQREILQRYRIGTFRLDLFPDERQEMSRLRAGDAAFRFLRVALLCFAAGYWMVYMWVPAGDWRDMLTDSPVVISWLVVFVITLQSQIEMWTEPEDVGEPRAVGRVAQAVSRSNYGSSTSN
jgi:hypothetical protein